MKKSIITVVVAALMSVLASATVFAADISISDKKPVFPEYPENRVIVNYPEGRPEVPFAAEDPGSNGATELPRRYSARDKNELPAVRDQLTTGTCWAHGMIGAIEADLIHDKKSSTDIDLSENHLAYYMYCKYEDPKKCRTDYVTLTGTTYLLNGGDPAMASALLSKLVGAVKEEDAPLSEDPEDFAPKDSSYVVSKDVAQVRDAFYINNKDSVSIKSAIMEHGAVTASIAMTADFYDGDHNSYYSNLEYTNHTVMFVGWDDDYSKDDFNSSAGIKPEGDGAWLVRNSWGAGWGDEGYFWLSYYDTSFTDSQFNNCVAVNASNDTYDNCYAYDGGLTVTDLINIKKDETIYVEYDVNAHEAVKGVSVEIASANTAVTVTATNKKTGESVVKGRKAGLAGIYTIVFDKPLEVYEDSTVEVAINLITDDGSGAVLAMEYPEEFKVFQNVDVISHPTVDKGCRVDSEEMGADPHVHLYTDKSNATYKKVTGISLGKKKATVKDGKTLKLKAEVLPADADYKYVTWSSSDESIATVSEKGVVTALKPGEVTITCTTVDQGKKAKCKVNVVAVSVDSISFNKTRVSVGRGGTVTLKAVFKPGNASNKNIKWVSRNEKVATVDKNGVVKAKKEGETKITATTEDGGRKAYCTVKVVKPVKVKSVKLNKKTAKIDVGGTIKLKAKISPKDATVKAVTWKSSNKKVATVDKNGNVKGIKKGRAKITVTTKDGKKKATCKINVK